MKGTDSTTAKQQYILFAQERLNIDELAKDSASSSSGAVIAIAALLGGGGFVLSVSYSCCLKGSHFLPIAALLSFLFFSPYRRDGSRRKKCVCMCKSVYVCKDGWVCKCVCGWVGFVCMCACVRVYVCEA